MVIEWQKAKKKLEIELPSDVNNNKNRKNDLQNKIIPKTEIDKKVE